MTDTAKKSGWKKYPANTFHPHSECFWQKKIGGQYVEVVKYEWEDRSATYDVNTQLQYKDKAMNIKIFSYNTIDWERFENDALEIINKLTETGGTKARSKALVFLASVALYFRNVVRREEIAMEDWKADFDARYELFRGNKDMFKMWIAKKLEDKDRFYLNEMAVADLKRNKPKDD